MRRRHAARLTTMLALPGLLLAFGAAPAAAHTHPSQVELDAPAVVFVRTFAQVTLSLVEHNRKGRHIGLYQRTYEPELASGSGFAVNPNGAVVTAGAVVTPDLKRAEVWAVNKAFNERYHANAPAPGDPFSRHHIKDLPDDPLDQRLQRCYQPNTTDNTGGCLVSTVRVVRVYPWVSDQAKFGQLTAEVVSPSAGKTQDVAVLRVGASSMPTVALATTAASAKAFTVLGFSTEPSAQVASEQQLIGHFKAKGGGPLDKDEFLPKLTQGLRAGTSGGPLVAAETGQVAGFLALAPDATGDPAFVDVKRIREVLADAGVDPHRGPTDAVFEDAMHSFKNKLYTAPIPSFQKALEFYPGHALATAYLAESKAKAGGPQDLTGKGTQLGGSGVGRQRNVLFWVVSGLVLVLLLVALALFVLLRRRAARRPQSGGGQGGQPPAPVVAPPPAEASHMAPASARAAPPMPKPGPPVPKPGEPARPVTSTGWRVPERHPAPEIAPVATPDKAADGPGRALTPAAPLLMRGHVGGGDAGAEAAAAPERQAGASQVFCTQCGKRLGQGHQFCGFCGAPVS